MTSVSWFRWLAKASPASYVAILLIAIATSMGLKVRLHGVFACPASYGGVAYLSDCAASNYGDFDHGAFWFELEPDAVRAARRASVVLLGNSRLQFAFSSAETTRWFAERSIPFYALGFTLNESVTFMTPLLERVQPQASAYIINADRFFADWLSPVSQRVVYERDARALYVEKQLWQWVHKPVCGALPLLCGKWFAVYRNVADGTWFTSGRLPAYLVPVRVSEGAPSDMERWPHYIDLAKAFVDALNIDRRCVVLTIVPTIDTRRAEAQAIADALGVQFVAPRVDNLSTFDGSHLNPESAARWSAAFLQEAGPVLERCAGGRPPAHGS